MSIEPVIINKVIGNIEKHNLINRGDTVVIGDIEFEFVD